jgi:hypothetical protein
MSETHFPVRNGTLCGKFPVPTDARDYDPNDPTCETCAKRLKAAQTNTARIMANAAAAAKAADKLAAAPDTKPGKRTPTE